MSLNSGDVMEFAEKDRLYFAAMRSRNRYRSKYRKLLKENEKLRKQAIAADAAGERQ